MFHEPNDPNHTIKEAPPSLGTSNLNPDFASDPRMQFVQETEKWTYIANDGVSYEYDEIHKAWFPMYNEDLIEAQQSAYSIPGIDEAEPVVSKQKTKRKIVYTMDDTGQSSKKQKPNNQGKKKPNTSVYVTGLPKDVSSEEIAQVFSKCGLLMEDYVKGGPRIKIYTDEKGIPKGDAVVTYLKEESVTLACQLLDDTDLRSNEPSKIYVQLAEFKEKEPKPAEAQKNVSGLQPDVKVNKREIQKKIQQLGKKLEWFDEESGRRSERSSKMVVLKYMFTLEELEEDPGLLLELKQDIRSDCENLGEVTNVVLYDQEPEGIVVVKFKEQLSAEACVLKNNGRFFSGRRISAEIYDGKKKFLKTNSRSNETEEEEAARLEKYAKWLEGEEKVFLKDAETASTENTKNDVKYKKNKLLRKNLTRAYDLTPPRVEDSDSDDTDEKIKLRYLVVNPEG
ncbi:hypothetical protein G9A89_022323 [Geosiphon pyriformis]|nr:hypothetical protein G9A89_022323 [Geosiphon pyriformis]